MSDTPKEYDIRVVWFHLRNGNVAHKDYDAYLAALPDDTEEAVESKIRFDNAYERRAAAEAQGN